MLFSLFEVSGSVAIWVINKTFNWMWPVLNPQQELLIELKQVLENQNKIQIQLDSIESQRKLEV